MLGTGILVRGAITRALASRAAIAADAVETALPSGPATVTVPGGPAYTVTTPVPGGPAFTVTTPVPSGPAFTVTTTPVPGIPVSPLVPIAGGVRPPVAPVPPPVEAPVVPESVAPVAGRPIVNGKVVPELKQGSDAEMAKEALGHFKTTTQGWTAADKAAYWEALAAQIEARHAPAWVSVALRGPNGEYIFSGGNLNVHGMVITNSGKVLRIPQDCTITPDFTKPGAATVNYNNPQ